MNPTAPRFFGLPKIHKNDIPIRPVVSCVSTPNHLLAKKLNEIFRELSQFSAEYSVKNSVDFVNKLSVKKIHKKCMLVSFDVSNLFTNVDPTEAVDLAETILLRRSVPAPILSELLVLFKLCVSQNYFLFNGTYFKQPKGLAMGSPLSPLLADIYMDSFEKSVFSSAHPLLKNVVCWFRYVDDVFCAWSGTGRQLEIFLGHLNSIKPNIKFTMEKEENGSLNFLDISISKSEEGLQYSVFRKDSYTDHVIHANSRHCFPQKLSAFHAMIHRLTSIPMSNSMLLKELNTIKQIAVNNGYPENLINKLYRRKMSQKARDDIYRSQPREGSNAKWKRCLYLGPLSQKVCSKIPKTKVKVAFYNKKCLKNLLSHTKDKIPVLEQSGVYKLSCECGAAYVGQTGRKFKERLKEHETCAKNKDVTSLFAKHLIETNHKSDFNPIILHRERKGQRLDALEQLEILKSVKCKEEILNEFLFPCHSPLLDLPPNLSSTSPS
jgi:predicted GIY-YIG superfamily endonuclease